MVGTNETNKANKLARLKFLDDRKFDLEGMNKYYDEELKGYENQKSIGE